MKNKNKRLIIIGAGGFAREVRWLAEDITESTDNPACFEFAGYVVSDLEKIGKNDSGKDVLGNFKWLLDNTNAFDCLAIGVGSPVARNEIASDLERSFGPEYWPSLIHPSAQFDRKTCTVSRGVLICANVVGTVNVSFKEFSMINLSCTIGHEAVIGRATTLNPTVNISGGATLGESVLVGTGAQVLQYLDVGSNSTIGAGAVVNKPVISGTTVVGIPAKPIG